MYVLCSLFCFQVEAMKIGAKEMKRAYKDVKLDQIDVLILFHPITFMYMYFCIEMYVTVWKLSGFTGPARGHDGRSQRGAGGPEPQLRHSRHR